MRDSYTSKADIRREKEREKERAKLERSGCGSGHDYVEVSSRCFTNTERTSERNSPDDFDNNWNYSTIDVVTTYLETTYKCSRCGDRDVRQEEGSSETFHVGNSD